MSSVTMFIQGTNGKHNVTFERVLGNGGFQRRWWWALQIDEHYGKWNNILVTTDLHQHTNTSCTGAYMPNNKYASITVQMKSDLVDIDAAALHVYSIYLIIFLRTECRNLSININICAFKLQIRDFWSKWQPFMSRTGSFLHSIEHNKKG